MEIVKVGTRTARLEGLAQNAVPIEDRMTPEEVEGFMRDPGDWGDENAAAARGAVFLDRELPGWADRVELNTLDLANTCHCVLGQLFADKALSHEDASGISYYKVVDANGEPTGKSVFDYVSGYRFAKSTLGLDWSDGHIQEGYNAASYFGFDYADELYSFYKLQVAWKPLIAARQRATVG